MIHRFGEFELDTNTFSLRNGEIPLHVEPLVFDLIQYLTDHAGEVVSRDAIIQEVWNGRFISDATLSSAIKAARKALGDSGEKQQYIRTVRGRGFQFVAAVDQIEDTQTDVTQKVSAFQSSNNKLPSLLIFPLDTFGHAKELQPIADGLVENLTTILTRIPLLRIASRTAAFAYKENYGEDLETTHQPDTDWLLEGSVQIISGNLRVNLQLIETSNSFHLWAQQFDKPYPLDDFETLLDDLLAKLEPQLVRAIYNQVRTSDGEPGSKELLLQAMGLLSLKGWHKDTFQESAGLLRKAINKDPNLALARAYLALILGLGNRVGLLPKSAEIVQEAEEEAEIALNLDNMDSIVVGLAGCSLADIGQPQRAIPLLKHAIELNPNNGHAWSALGSAQVMLQQFDEAIPNLRKGIDVSPADSRRAVWCAVLAIAHLHVGISEKAVAMAKEACTYDDRNYIPKVVLAGSFLTARNQKQALDALNECYRVKADLSEMEIRGLLGSRLSSNLLKLT